jgi:hypothetical protein
MVTFKLNFLGVNIIKYFEILFNNNNNNSTLLGTYLSHYIHVFLSLYSCAHFVSSPFVYTLWLAVNPLVEA